MSETKPCVICAKPLTPVWVGEDVGWKYNQPNDGGEISLSFVYGSRHDCLIARALICDDCAESMMKKMEITNVMPGGDDADQIDWRLIDEALAELAVVRYEDFRRDELGME